MAKVKVNISRNKPVWVETEVDPMGCIHCTTTRCIGNQDIRCKESECILYGKTEDSPLYDFDWRECSNEEGL